MPSLLTLSEVMGTGHHAAVSAHVSAGKSVAVLGDGAVGLCRVIAAKRLGAEQIIVLGRHPERIALAREFGATDVVSERGEEAVEQVRDLTDGYGADSVLECVGLEQAVVTALQVARPGGAVGRVGIPEDESLPGGIPFWKNVSVAGGPAPVRAYIEELLPDVVDGKIEPGRVFDRPSTSTASRTAIARWTSGNRSRSWSSREARALTARAPRLPSARQWGALRDARRGSARRFRPSGRRFRRRGVPRLAGRPRAARAGRPLDPGRIRPGRGRRPGSRGRTRLPARCRPRVRDERALARSAPALQRAALLPDQRPLATRYLRDGAQ
jgi:hypothetical protein